MAIKRVTSYTEATGKNPFDDTAPIVPATSTYNSSQDPSFKKDPTKQYDVFGNVVGEYSQPAINTKGASSIRDRFAEAGLATSALPEMEVQQAEELKIKEAEKSRLEQIRGGISQDWTQKIERQKEIGAAEVGGTAARLAITRGAGASSSRLILLADQQRQNDRFIKEMELARDSALLASDIASADREDKRIKELREYNWTSVQKINDEKQRVYDNSIKAEEMEMKREEMARKAKPTYQKLSAGESLVNPQTGEIIASLPNKEVAEKIQTYGNEKTGLYQYSADDNTWTQVIAPADTPDEFVSGMIKKYYDADILPTDTLEQARLKLPKSRIYQDEIRGPVGKTTTTLDNYSSLKSQLESSRGDDITPQNPKGEIGKGYVNTDKYKELRMSAKDKTTFDKNFSYMLNPKDLSAKEFFTQAELKIPVVGWGEISPDTGKTPEQAFLDMGISQEMIDMAQSAGLNPKDLF